MAKIASFLASILNLHVTFYKPCQNNISFLSRPIIDRLALAKQGDNIFGTLRKKGTETVPLGYYCYYSLRGNA